MAHHVIGAGFSVQVFDVSPPAVALLVAEGAQPAATAHDLARQSDVVITVLPDAAAVETAILGETGIATGIRPGAVVVEMSTIAPSLTRRLGQAIEQRGAHYLDCPISGGVPGAEQGTLTLMVGGQTAVLEGCRDVLEPMAGAIYHMGPVGAGLTAKLINQLLTMTQTVLVVEALAMGARAGVNLSTLHELIGKSSGRSWCWEHRIPRILEKPDDAWVTVDICHKDLGLAKALGEELGVPLFVAAGAFQVLQMAKAMRLGEHDVSALGTLYEQMLGMEMRADSDARSGGGSPQ
jgi:3-hydroxyisobutyrate dehydrogenase-like beta-hydroxyacid dehydrogenase